MCIGMHSDKNIQEYIRIYYVQECMYVELKLSIKIAIFQISDEELYRRVELGF